MERGEMDRRTWWQVGLIIGNLWLIALLLILVLR